MLPYRICQICRKKPAPLPEPRLLPVSAHSAGLLRARHPGLEIILRQSGVRAGARAWGGDSMGDSDDGGDDEPRRGAQLQRYEHRDNDTAAQSKLLRLVF